MGESSGRVARDQFRPVIGPTRPGNKLCLFWREAATGQARKVALVPRVLGRAGHLLPLDEQEQRNAVVLSDRRARLDRPSETQSLLSSLMARVRTKYTDPVPISCTYGAQIDHVCAAQLCCDGVGNRAGPAPNERRTYRNEEAELSHRAKPVL
jgi:hypothetical protein